MQIAFKSKSGGRSGAEGVEGGDGSNALKLINSKWLDCLEPNLKKGEPDKLLKRVPL